MGHLKLAKNTQESQKDTLTKQQENFTKIKEKEVQVYGEFKEKQKQDIEAKHEDELKKQIDNERRQSLVDQEILLKKTEKNYFAYTNFFATKAEPKIYWKMAKPKENIETNILENKNSIQGLKDDYIKKTKLIFQEINKEFEKNAEERLRDESKKREDMKNVTQKNNTKSPGRLDGSDHKDQDDNSKIKSADSNSYSVASKKDLDKQDDLASEEDDAESKAKKTVEKSYDFDNLLGKREHIESIEQEKVDLEIDKIVRELSDNED